MLIALRFNPRVDYNIKLPQNKAKTSTVASSKVEASSSFKGFGFFKTLNTTWFNTYHTTPQSTTKETPFSLVYGSDAMILVEIQENSPRF